MTLPQQLFSFLEDYRRQSAKNDKTIISLCNSIIKSATDEKLIEKATQEKRKAQKRLDKDDSKFMEAVREAIYEYDTPDSENNS